MKKGKAKKSQVPVAKKPRWKIVVEAIILISAIATIIQVAITIQQMQSQPAPETPLKSDFIIKNVSNIDLYGNSFNWQSTFSVTLDIESPNPCKISVTTANQSFVLGVNSYMLITENYPTNVTITDLTEVHSPVGISELRLDIPVHAQFLVSGFYQSYEHHITIGQLEFLISIEDLKSGEVSQISKSTTVNWIG